MFALSEAHKALAAVDLRHGLPTADVFDRLHQGLRLRQTGNRILAFYLTEMDARGLHQAAGHPTTAHYAEAVLEMDRRRVQELLVVGRKLLELPVIDAAFCRGELAWSKLILLTRVAVPEHEEAWLKRALSSTARALALEIKLTRPGSPPRKPGDRKGLPEVRFGISMKVDVLTHTKFELARRKFAAERDALEGVERGGGVSDAEFLDVLADLFLQFQETGRVEGRTRVDASLYRIVTRPDPEAPGQLLIETEDGEVPVPRPECVQCDAQHVHVQSRRTDATQGEQNETGEPTPGEPTPSALRRRVLNRDAHRCRHCHSRAGLMVHHLRYRSHGGPTTTANLITLCTRCHALVHADLLEIVAAQAGEPPHAEQALFRPKDPAMRNIPRPSMPLTKMPPEGMSPEMQPKGAAPLEDARAATGPTAPDTAEGRGEGREGTEEGSATGTGANGRMGCSAQEIARERSRFADGDRLDEPLTRAQAFAGIVGQRERLDRLVDSAAGSRARREPFPHTLFTGPPGTGKTTLSRGIVALLGAPFLQTCGPLLPDAPAVSALVDGLPPGAVLFLDEIHAVPRPALEVLYGHMDAKRVVILGATTEEGELPDALISRFGLRESLQFHEPEDLAAIACARARTEGCALEGEAALLIAGAARGTPRETLRLLDRVLDEAALLRVEVVARELAGAVLKRLGFDAEGLSENERRYLAVLRASRDPVPLGRIARLLGLSRRTLLRHVEPFLFFRGCVRTTQRGRVLVR